MTPEEFKQAMRTNSFKLFELIDNKLPDIAGKEAVDFFLQNFYTESWEGKKWKEVKRRRTTWKRGNKFVPNPTRGAARSRRILTGSTGDLGRSLQYKVHPRKAIIFSDVLYAPVHNFGMMAGRGKGFKMARRQFVGHSPRLITKVRELAVSEINKIIKP